MHSLSIVFCCQIALNGFKWCWARLLRKVLGQCRYQYHQRLASIGQYPNTGIVRTLPLCIVCFYALYIHAAFLHHWRVYFIRLLQLNDHEVHRSDRVINRLIMNTAAVNVEHMQRIWQEARLIDIDWRCATQIDLLTYLLTYLPHVVTVQMHRIIVFVTATATLKFHLFLFNGLSFVGLPFAGSYLLNPENLWDLRTEEQMFLVAKHCPYQTRVTVLN